MSAENSIPIPESVWKSTVPQYFHPLTGTPYQATLMPLSSTLVVVGYTQSQCIHAVLLSSSGITALDTGGHVEYTEYRSHGVRGICESLDFQGATSFRYYLDPKLADIRTVLADLLEASRPGALCTEKTQRSNGNVYVPDYLSLLGVVHADNSGIPR